MGQIITALFDSRSAAEAVQNELRYLGIVKDQDDSTSYRTNRGYVYDQSDSRYRAGTYSSDSDRRIWGDAGWDDDDYRVPDEDRHLYEEGVHRGKTLLTVTVDDEMADRAREIIDRSNAHDIDAESTSWRNEGWTSPSTTAAGTAAGATAGSYYTRDTSATSSRYRSYRRDAGNGPGETSYKASGYANEAIGNVKQAVGSVTGSESLRQSGVAQERKGEHQEREAERRGDQGNEF